MLHSAVVEYLSVASELWQDCPRLRQRGVVVWLCPCPLASSGHRDEWH